ncbi:MAG: hypothetical protein ABIT20_05490 [Gemmatimonadaceae bacterium]
MNRRLFILCALVLASACGSDSGTGPPPTVGSVAGTWKLTSVDGKPLPYVYQASDPKLELIAKQYVITSASTYTSSFTLRGTELDGTVNTTTSNDAGATTLSGNTVQFTSSTDAFVFFAEATTTTFTIAGPVTQVFTKQ